MHRLRTLGGAALLRDGRPVDRVGAQRKLIALLALLAAARQRGTSRERIASLLWPESDLERSRGALKQLLHVLRRRIGTSAVVIGGAEIRLNPDHIESDLDEFLSAAEGRAAGGDGHGRRWSESEGAAQATRSPPRIRQGASSQPARALRGHCRARRSGGRGRAVAAGAHGSTGPLPPPDASIAVLPFVNTGGASADAHFSDGLTDELISRLGKVQGLRVAARTSTFALKGKGLSARAIADTLGVATLLEGSVRRIGDRVKITVQLVEAQSNAILWSEAYDREMQDVFAMQDDIARAIAGSLQAGTPAGIVARGSGRPTADLEAYDLYLRARYDWHLPHRERLQQANPLFSAGARARPRVRAGSCGPRRGVREPRPLRLSAGAPIPCSLTSGRIRGTSSCCEGWEPTGNRCVTAI